MLILEGTIPAGYPDARICVDNITSYTEPCSALQPSATVVKRQWYLAHYFGITFVSALVLGLTIPIVFLVILFWACRRRHRLLRPRYTNNKLFSTNLWYYIGGKDMCEEPPAPGYRNSLLHSPKPYNGTTLSRDSLLAPSEQLGGNPGGMPMDLPDVVIPGGRVVSFNNFPGSTLVGPTGTLRRPAAASMAGGQQTMMLMPGSPMCQMAAGGAPVMAPSRSTNTTTTTALISNVLASSSADRMPPPGHMSAVFGADGQSMFMPTGAEVVTSYPQTSAAFSSSTGQAFPMIMTQSVAPGYPSSQCNATGSFSEDGAASYNVSSATLPHQPQHANQPPYQSSPPVHSQQQQQQQHPQHQQGIAMVSQPQQQQQQVPHSFVQSVVHQTPIVSVAAPQSLGSEQTQQVFGKAVHNQQQQLQPIQQMQPQQTQQSVQPQQQHIMNQFPVQQRPTTVAPAIQPQQQQQTQQQLAPPPNSQLKQRCPPQQCAAISPNTHFSANTTSSPPTAAVNQPIAAVSPTSRATPQSLASTPRPVDSMTYADQQAAVAALLAATEEPETAGEQQQMGAMSPAINGQPRESHAHNGGDFPLPPPPAENAPIYNGGGEHPPPDYDEVIGLKSGAAMAAAGHYAMGGCMSYAPTMVKPAIPTPASPALPPPALPPRRIVNGMPADEVEQHQHQQANNACISLAERYGLPVAEI